MSSVQVIDLISRAESILKDHNVRWPRLELQNWLNDAYREVVVLRPDANAKSGELTCVAGTRQSLSSVSSSALQLIDVVRNTAPSSAKKSVRLVDRQILDDQRPGWHGEPGTVNIQQYMHDPRLPKEFLVYPPATTNAKLEVVFSSLPGVHTMSEAILDPAQGNTTLILLDDIYATPLLDLMLYRAYSKDSGVAENANRAMGHYNAALSFLGTKTNIDLATSPK